MESISIWSMKTFKWKCSECDTEFKRTVNNMIRCSGRCPEHSIKMKTKKRRRYNGSIPVEQTMLLRSSILREVERNNTIANLCGIFKLTEEQAAMFYDEIKEYNRVDLLDNGFWWQDTMSRKRGTRYSRRDAKTKKANHEEHQSSNERNLVTNVEETRRTNDTNKLILVDNLNFEKHLWAPLLLEIQDDLSRLKSLWIKEVYWRLLLPDADVNKSFGSSAFNWEATAERLRSLAAVLPDFCFAPDRPKTTQEHYRIPALLQSYHWRRNIQRTETGIKQFLQMLYDRFMSEPQIID